MKALILIVVGASLIPALIALFIIDSSNLARVVPSHRIDVQLALAANSEGVK